MIEFQKMASVGRSMVLEHCRAHGLAPKELAEHTGCNEKRVAAFIASPAFLLTGLEWEQLMYVCTDRPEMWIYRAQQEGTAETINTEFRNAASERPSPEDDMRIRDLLSIVMEFYQMASQRYLEQENLSGVSD